jgi:hypothetical protein
MGRLWNRAARGGGSTSSVQFEASGGGSAPDYGICSNSLSRPVILDFCTLFNMSRALWRSDILGNYRKDRQ